MALSYDLISQFAKLTKTSTPTNTESTVYGTYHDKDENGVGGTYVQLDGSERIIPVESSSTAVDGERVSVLIKNHTATVTGNMSPDGRSARNEETVNVKVHTVTQEETTDMTAKIAYIGEIIATIGKYQDISAVTAKLENLSATYIEGKTLKVEDIEAVTAVLKSIKADIGEFSKVVTDEVDTENLNAAVAKIDELTATTAKFTYISASKADIDNLTVKKLDADWANIDYANIDQAKFRVFYAESGVVEYMDIKDVTIPGRLIGVTIIGDQIEAGTLKADQLVVLGSDGNYYKLNTDFAGMPGVEPVEESSIHGSVLVANSITAEKLSVSDLVAFGATIGGFNITNKSIHSNLKESVVSSIPGVYMDNDGQVALGNDYNYLKFYKVVDENGDDVLDENGDTLYRLAISADSILFGVNSKTSTADLEALMEHIRMGTVIDEKTGDKQPCIELAEGDSVFKQVITNVKTVFMDGETPKTTIDKDGIDTDKLTANGDFEHKNPSGSFVWAFRSNGNYGLSWKEATS